MERPSVHTPHSDKLTLVLMERAICFGNRMEIEFTSSANPIFFFCPLIKSSRKEESKQLKYFCVTLNFRKFGTCCLLEKALKAHPTALLFSPFPLMLASIFSWGREGDERIPQEYEHVYHIYEFMNLMLLLIKLSPCQA
jgi:hypothetical protein